MTQSPADSELVARCLALHPEPSPAFDLLYQRHAGALVSFLHGLHRHDVHAARDAHQETWLRAWRALPSFDAARPLRPWLLRIARNASLDQWKKAAAKQEQGVDDLAALSPDAGPAAGEALALREAAGLLRGAVLDLPEDQRAVFLLKHEQGLTYAEVAAVVGCSLRTAKYRMAAALEALGRAAERLGVEA